jgi:hypothetical protein
MVTITIRQSDFAPKTVKAEVGTTYRELAEQYNLPISAVFRAWGRTVDKDEMIPDEDFTLSLVKEATQN